MKKKEIPNLVFTKEYEYYFLFTEYDVVFNEQFYKKLNQFLKEVGSEKLTIELDNELELRNIKKQYVYNFPFSNEIEMFHNLDINDFAIYNINHFIKDNSFQWEIFISIENELSIMAVNSDLLDIFKTIFKPYQEETIDVKLNVICGQFVDELQKNKFKNELLKIYKFR